MPTLRVAALAAIIGSAIYGPLPMIPARTPLLTQDGHATAAVVALSGRRIPLVLDAVRRVECAPRLQRRLMTVQSLLDRSWAQAKSEATLLLNNRSPGAECARRAVVVLLGGKRSDDAMTLLIDAIRSEPDRAIRRLILEQLAGADFDSPAIRAYLSAGAPVLPLREGFPEITVVMGLVGDKNGGPVTSTDVTVSYYEGVCVGRAREVVTSAVDDSGRFEAAFRRVNRQGGGCVEATAASASSRVTLGRQPEATTDGSRLKSDTVRLAVRLPRD